VYCNVCGVWVAAEWCVCARSCIPLCIAMCTQVQISKDVMHKFAGEGGLLYYTFCYKDVIFPPLVHEFQFEAVSVNCSLNDFIVIQLWPGYIAANYMHDCRDVQT